MGSRWLERRLTGRWFEQVIYVREASEQRLDGASDTIHAGDGAKASGMHGAQGRRAGGTFYKGLTCLRMTRCWSSWRIFDVDVRAWRHQKPLDATWTALAVRVFKSRAARLIVGLQR